MGHSKLTRLWKSKRERILQFMALSRSLGLAQLLTFPFCVGSSPTILEKRKSKRLLPETARSAICSGNQDTDEERSQNIR